MQQFFGQILQELRLINELTQDELAEKISVSKQYISSLEKSNVSPQNKILCEALCEVLHVEKDFFSRKQEEVFIHFRSQRSISKKMKNTSEVHSKYYAHIISHLGIVEKQLNVPDCPMKYGFSNDEKERDFISDAVKKTRECWKLEQNTPIDNLTSCLEQNGFLVDYFNHIPDKIDAFSVCGKHPVILVNKDVKSAVRIRFSQAHECAHIVLHKMQHTGDPITEKQANIFASLLLLPDEVLFQEFPRPINNKLDWEKIFKMKIKYKVSVVAILYRAYEQKIIGAVVYRNAYIHINKNGWRKIEKFDEEITIDEPSIVPFVLKNFSQDSDKFNKLAEKIGLNEGLCRKIMNLLH